MALGRKVLAGVSFVMPHDTAIDDTKCSYADYMLSLFDVSKLVFKDGEQPTVFKLRQMTHRQVVARDQLDTEIERSVFSVRCGLTKVENFIVEDEEGNRKNLPPIRYETAGEFGDILAESWLNEAQLGSGNIQLLAMAIEGVSHASPPSLRPSSTPVGGSQSESQSVEVQAA